MMENNHEQRWDPVAYARHAAFNVDLAGPVLSLLAARPGERILDLGCGDGALTRRLVDAGCTVVGVDSSPEQVAGACARGLDARVADGEDLAFANAFDAVFSNAFDAVFSNAALHWMKRPERVIQGVRRALKPGGRFVGEFGGHGCVAAIRVALYAVLARHGLQGAPRDPWYFPDPEAYGAQLQAAGFDVRHMELTARPTPLPTGLEGWLETFAGSFLHALPQADRRSARDEVIALAAPALRNSRGTWTADYMRLRFIAKHAL